MSGLDASARAALALSADVPSICEGSAALAQQQYLDGFAQDQLPLAPVAKVDEVFVGNVRVKVWRGLGASDAEAPALLYLHGGGWVIGSPETHEDICRTLANLSQAVVISPDYRLAPEHPFPAGLDDCASVLLHLFDNAKELGVDPRRIAVGGDSAGGNLAAVLALMSRNGDVPQVSAQLLIYPVTDQHQDSESYKTFAQDHGLTAQEMAWFRGHYLRSDVDMDDWRAAPLKAKSLVGVAPALVVLAGCDVLHDEGAAYAARIDHEATASCVCWPGQIHGFVSKGGVIPQAMEALTALSDGWKAIDPLFELVAD